MRKVANFLVEDARLDPDPAAEAAIGLAGGTAPGTELVLERFRARHGGLWVGGTFVVTDATVKFHVNALNRLVQSGSLDVVLALSDIGAVHHVPAFGADIVVLDAGHQRAKARMWGAQQVVRILNGMLDAAR